MSKFEARAHLKVRDGQLQGFKRQASEMMRVTREQDTGTLAYNWFLSKDGTECEVHESYVDADALVTRIISDACRLNPSSCPSRTFRWARASNLLMVVPPELE